MFKLIFYLGTHVSIPLIFIIHFVLSMNFIIDFILYGFEFKFNEHIGKLDMT
jgi:hypothetical protein